MKSVARQNNPVVADGRLHIYGVIGRKEAAANRAEAKAAALRADANELRRQIAELEAAK